MNEKQTTNKQAHSQREEVGCSVLLAKENTEMRRILNGFVEAMEDMRDMRFLKGRMKFYNVAHPLKREAKMLLLGINEDDLNESRLEKNNLS